MKRLQVRRNDTGESLIEVLMSLAILGIAVVALVGSMSTFIVGSDIHRNQSSGTTVLLSAAEGLKGAAYVACASPTTYASVLAAVVRPAGWAPPTITQVTYWNGTGFDTTCRDTAAFGNLLKLQQLTVQTQDPGTRAVETVSVTKRGGT